MDAIVYILMVFLLSLLWYVFQISILCREKASQAFPTSPPEEVLSRAFYSGPCFAATAQLLRSEALSMTAPQFEVFRC